MSMRFARRSAAAVSCLLVLASLGASARAGEPEKPGSLLIDKPTDSWEQFPSAWEKALRTMGDDTLYLLTSPLRLDTESALVAGGIGAGIVGLSLADRSIRDELAPHRHDSVRDAAEGISLLGNGFVLLGLNAATMTVGEAIREYNGNSKVLDAALVMTESQVLTVALTEGLAYATARCRPDRKNDPFRFRFDCESFPSAHASQAFAVAAVVADRAPLPVGIIAYGLAGLVGASRLVQDKHWASDVAAGAALGWAVGHFLSVRHSRPHEYLDFLPFVDLPTKTYGVSFTKPF